MGIAVSLILIAAGAILTWAVNADPEGLDVNVVGVVLMIVGIVSFLLTLLFWQSWWGPGYFRRGGAYAEGAPRARRAYGGRRTEYVEEEAPRATYVEEEEIPPAGPGAPPPP
ncbi:MAG: hypothetical protein H0U03_00175 [Actinobacteria bacterium]|nr:hypothetical protein [Actinomycetota bacterium]